MRAVRTLLPTAVAAIFIFSMIMVMDGHVASAGGSELDLEVKDTESGSRGILGSGDNNPAWERAKNQYRRRSARYAMKREGRLRRDERRARRLREIRRRRRLAAQRASLGFQNQREGRLFKCVKKDCSSPHHCFNYKGQRIRSRRYKRAFQKNGVWYRKPGSNKVWRSCKWKKQRNPQCNPTDPTVKLVAGSWVKKPLHQRRNFVYRNGKWWKSQYSNHYYKNCEWVLQRVHRKNCQDPTVRRVAGRWIKKSLHAIKDMIRHRGKWYLGKRREFVWRKCRWVKSTSYKAQAAAVTVAQAEARLPMDKAKVKYWKKQERRYLSKNLAVLEKKYPAESAINLMTPSDMKAAVNRIATEEAKRSVHDLEVYFLRKYTPKATEIRRKGKYDNPNVAYGDTSIRMTNEAPPNPSSTVPTHAYFDETDPEPNSRVGKKVSARKIFTSRDFLKSKKVWPKDPRDPEPGLSPDFEPGAILRNAGKNSHQRLQVIGEEELLRNPGHDTQFAPERRLRKNSPSLSFAR